MSEEFLVMGLHRSGTNFVQNLIEQKLGYKQTERNGGDEKSVVWKHHFPSPENLEKMNMKYYFVIRHPMKWLNSVVKFNAGLWKNPYIHSDNQNEFSILYKVKENKFFMLSIPKIIHVWNKWYSYPNLEPMYKYHDVLKDPKIILDNYVLPTQLEHSPLWNEQKTKEELDLEYLPNLTPIQKEYAYSSFDWSLYN